MKLEKYRKILLKKRAQILERFFKQEDTQKVLTEQAGEPRDIPEYALIDITQEILSQLEEIEMELLNQIDRSLERIDNGSYGLCEVCRKKIKEERLEAVPWTTLCIDHAQELDQIKATPDTRCKDYFDKLTIKEKSTSEEKLGEL
ncbi:MAG: TraR/DksA C4-type zinc finger protein [Hydrogenothermaceae bacterium]|nr:TraR/DksA C4-type zinc finger protein [Hydrogenothermaceae bacterium]